MRNFIFVFLFVINICPEIISQQRFPSYYEVNDFNFAPAGALKYGLYGYDNPAVLTYLHQPDIYFTWNDLGGDFNDLNNWGLFTAIPNFGFSVVSFGDKTNSVFNYTLSAAFGGPSLSLGLAYKWTSGDFEEFNIANEFTVGSLIRLNRYFSLGLVGNFPIKGEREGVVGLAFRPFGNEVIAFFGDYIFTENNIRNEIRWSSGVAVEPFDGIRFIGRYFEGKAFNIGTQISFGNFGLNYQSHFNSDKKSRL